MEKTMRSTACETSRRPLTKQVWSPGERCGLRDGWEPNLRAYVRMSEERDGTRKASIYHRARNDTNG